jgi:long-subunit fatty acid transport protein
MFTRFILLISFLAFGLVQAQDETDAIRPFQNEFGPGARAMALGGAYSAIAEDYSAVYWNPAGLTQIRKMEFYGSLSHLRTDNRIGYQGTVTENTNGFTNVNAVGLVFPIPTYRGSLVMAIGYHRINQFDDFNQVIGSPVVYGKRFDQIEKTTVDGSLNQWAFAGAVDLTPNFSVGASLNLLVGNNNLSVNYFEDNPNGVIANESFRRVAFQIKPDYSGVSFKMGAMLRPANNFRIAMTVTTPSVVHVEENSHYSETIDDTLVVANDPLFLKYKTTSPWRFELGASYKYKLVTLSSSVDFIDWTQTRFSSNITDQNGNIDGDINQAILTKYRQATNYHLGAEVVIPNVGAKVMAGYYYQESPFKNGQEIINSNRKYVSAGVSFLVDQQVKIDFAFQHGWWRQATTDTQLGLDENGNAYYTNEKIRTNRLLVGLSYRF